jgi:fructose-1,6-bisphosphatase I
MQQQSLTSFIADQKAAAEVAAALKAIAGACVAIQRAVASGPLDGTLQSSMTVNVQQEVQTKLDIIANDILCDRLRRCEAVAGFASEELTSHCATGRQGGVLVTFDPLDGSSNVDVNASVGTIFSILPAPPGREPGEEDFLRPGREQLAAGYAIYGPQTNLVLTVADGVAVFTLDTSGRWRLTRRSLQVPAQTAEFAINASNARHWAEPVAQYVAECVAGEEGPRAKNFNMRWTASMVADVHRILTRGGVFLYPWDRRDPARPGKLRLLYEGAPMALLVERAGGKAIDGRDRLLDLIPERLHQRVPVVLGSAEEVDRVAALSAAASGR